MPLARLDAATAAPSTAPDWSDTKPAPARQLAQTSITVPLPPPIAIESEPDASGPDVRTSGRPPLRRQPLAAVGTSPDLGPGATEPDSVPPAPPPTFEPQPGLSSVPDPRAQIPTTAIIAPDPNIQAYTTPMTAAEPQTQVPTTAITAPDPNIQAYTTPMTAPEPQTQVPTTAITAPEPQTQVPTTAITAPELQIQIPTAATTARPAQPYTTSGDAVIEVLAAPSAPGGDALPAPLGSELPLKDPAPSAGPAPDFDALGAVMRSLMDDSVVVATVDGEAIRWGEVFSSAQALPADHQARLETLFPALLERLIDLKLLAQAGRRQGLQHDTTLRARMAAYEERLVREALLEHYVAARVTDEAVRASYGTYLAKRKQDVEITARHILVENEDAAREVIRRLIQGADFADLARRISIAPSAKRGGDLGTFKSSRMVKGFAEAIRPLQAGQFTREPVQTEFGWHVILVESRSDALVPSFEAVAADLREDLSRQVIRALLSRLRAEAQIEILPDSALPLTMQQNSGPQSSGLAEPPAAGAP